MHHGYGMDTDVLRWFQLVADGTTVTEVAELHMISQPAVSRALSRLEEDLGTPLLHKTGRVLRLTHAGAVFKRQVDAVLHQLDDGLAAVSQLLDPETGIVALGFQPSSATWLVPAMIGDLVIRHPRVRLRLEQSQDASGSSAVETGGVDLEFTARRPRSPEIRWQRLITEPLWLAVPPDHRLADRDEVALSEATEDDFVLIRPAWERIRDAGASRDVGLAWSRERRLLPAAELFRQHVLTSGAGALLGAGASA